MSLQGSLDTFALPDVLMLIATTQKSGELRVSGSHTDDGHDEVSAEVWFDGGRIVRHAGGNAVDAADTVFDLLRLCRGSFSFTPRELDLGPAGDGEDVATALAAAQARLEEWAEIEAVVPSGRAWVQLAPVAPRAKVTLTAEQWKLIVAVGSGRSVTGVVEDLAAGEMAGRRAIKDIVALGLLQVDPDPDRATAEPETEAPAERLVWATPVSSWNAGARDLTDGSLETWSERPGAGDAARGGLYAVEGTVQGVEPAEAADDEAVAAAPLVDASVEEVETEPQVAAGRAAATATTAGDWRAQMAGIHDLDSLIEQTPFASSTAFDAPVSPVEVTEAQTVEEPAPSGEGDEPLNRGLLLKFLSSVRN